MGLKLQIGKRKLVIVFFYFQKYPYLYILRGFRKVIIDFFPVKNISKLINQQLKNGVKIVNL